MRYFLINDYEDIQDFRYALIFLGYLGIILKIYTNQEFILIPSDVNIM